MRSDILDFGVMNKTKEGCIHKGSGSLFFIIIKPRTSGFEIVGNELD